tara:strand:+ start:576 stop:905 length:330 start_codon:yes stop_codon:yes gene_type:complete
MAQILKTIKKRQTFVKVMNQGKFYRGKNININFLKDDKLDKLIFVGYTATKKIGASIQRNKAKRIMRELARKVITKYGTKNIYYVLIAKQSILKTSFKELETELKRLIS